MQEMQAKFNLFYNFFFVITLFGQPRLKTIPACFFLLGKSKKHKI